MIWPILVLAVLLRSVLLNGSFWMDEAAQVLESVRPFREQLSIPFDFQPPLFHILVHGLTRFSLEESWLRSVPLFAGVLTILTVFYWSVRFFRSGTDGVLVGLMSALLLATSGFHIFYSQELRPYSLAGLCAAVSWLVLIRALEKPSKKGWWVAYALSTGAGLYTMYVYPFAILGQLLWIVLVKRAALIPLTISLVGASLLFVPWIPSFLEQLRIGTALRGQLPGWSDVVSVPQWKALPIVVAKFAGGALPVDWGVRLLWSHALPMITMLIGFSGLLVGGWKKHKAVWRVFLCWAIIPVLAAWFVSFLVPVLSPKRVLYVLPGVLIAVSYGFLQLAPQLRRIGFGALILAQVVGVIGYWNTPALHREDWRGVLTLLREEFSPNNTVVVMGWYEPFAPWLLYESDVNQPYPVISVAEVRTVEESYLQERMPGVLPYTNVLVLDYLRDLTDPDRSIERWLEDQGYVGVQSIDTVNFGFIRHYKKQPVLGFASFGERSAHAGGY